MSSTKKSPYHESLLACYNDQAVVFGNTRKKPRPEIQHLERVLEKEVIGRFVDVGCGTGRLYERLRHLPGMEYSGIDAAQSMISVAREHYPEAHFEHADMYGYFSQQPQESIDTIVALASFHHLDNALTRRTVLSHMYKSLRRGGVCVLYNRSFSVRFLKKYRKNVLAAFARGVLPGSDLRRNDVLIPRKATDNGKRRIYHRLYHMFTLAELQDIARMAGFCIVSRGYISQTAETTQDRTISRNSYIVLKKAVATYPTEN